MKTKVISTLLLSVLCIGSTYASLASVGNSDVNDLDIVSPKDFPIPGKVYKPAKDTKWPKTQRYNREIVLTFDDGPDERLTPKVLDVLKKYDAKATFFILTKNINSKTIPIIKRMHREGHIIASHGDQHYNSNSISETKYKQNLKLSINKLEDIEEDLGINQKSMFYRFPYGAFARGLKKKYHHLNTMKKVSQEIYGENCINYAMWDIDTEDWVSDMTPQKIAQNMKAYIEGGTYYVHYKSGKKWKTKAKVMHNPPKGGIALLHDVKSKDIEAVEIFLKWSKKNAVDIIPLDSVQNYRYDSKVCERK